MAGNSNGGNNFGGTIAVGLLGIILILTAVLFPLSTDWKWFLSLTGVCIILLLIAGALWNTALIPSIIVFLIAVGVGIAAFYFFQRASRPQEEQTLLFQYYLQCIITQCQLVLG